METRKCKVCGEVKPITEYYKHGGYYDTKCKECAKAYSKRYAEEHAEHYKQYRKQRYAEHREEDMLRSKAWTEANRDKHNDYCKKWNNEHFEERREYLRKYRAENPEKYHATSRINYLVEKGKLTKPMACEVCGKVGRVEAHHADYSKPLDVMWVCKKCHYKLDEERREKERSMSVSKWAYTPEVCDGEYCIGDCDRCGIVAVIAELMEEEEDERLHKPTGGD